ncbi:hypothetical protein [Rufibacter roseus]|uniref:DUF4168 domain-containing protein n=1 Tax=Rufibacter roseus TaxID=1567108 RepID=A0ABW2DMS8_9BACT|nr:hypothetical protein [Rufibacter roseus]
MKTLVLAFALALSFAGISVAGSTSNSNAAAATASARQIANALELNEAMYLKVRILELNRIEALQQGAADVDVINENYTVALLQMLTPTQQKAYRALTGTQLVKYATK